MDRIQMVINYLEQHIHQKLSLEEIARAAYLSPVQLYRVFKKATGITPVQYHEYLRINASTEMLQQKGSITEVAFDLGYENYETFSRAFKRIVSISPSDLLWGLAYMEKQVPDNNYALVKTTVSALQIKQMVLASDKELIKPSELLIYRIASQKRNRPLIKRCKETEALLR